jgi:hypothetical protein
MPHRPYLEQLRVAKNMVPPTDTLGRVLTELLTLSANNKTFFNMTVGSANCVGLYKAGAPWGALVNFKTGNMPSFVHELTHASCFASYQKDLINYDPGHANAVPYAFTNAAIPNTPADTRACMNEVERRRGWYTAESSDFLTKNLNNLDAWADVTDFKAPLPWLDAQKAKQMALLEKNIAKGRGTVADMNRLQSMQSDNAAYGVLIAPKKKSQQALALETEANRKRDYIKERIAYGKNGQGGMGDVSYEYDTVVNQMLYQMFMWGFRPPARINPPLAMLAGLIEERKVPAQYLYGLIEDLAQDAYTRRAAAAQIAAGAAPTVRAPLRVINAPEH